MSRVSAGALVIERLLQAADGTTPALGRSFANITLTSIRRWKIKLPYKRPITLFRIHSNSSFGRRCRIVGFGTQNVTNVVITRLGDDATAVASRSPPDALGRAARGTRFSQNSGHDGSERTGGSRTSNDERSESFGIRTRCRTSLRSVRRGSNPGAAAARCRSRIAGTMGFEPTAIGLEVRRSVRTELRALEPQFRPDPKRRCGAGLPPKWRLPNGQRTGTMGVSEPQVRERRKTSGASLSEFSLDARPHSVRSAVVRIPVPLPLASLADSGHGGSEPTAIGCLPAPRTRRG